MESNNIRPYYVGLDLGTSSIGWAVVDENNKLIKKRGQNLWGVRLFNEAKTALERRNFRRQRRTINKRNWRLFLLKQELKELVLKEDSSFYDRLNLSKIKESGFEKTLFEGKYNDVNYYSEFPTIYHLRSDLMNLEKCKKHYNKGRYFRFVFLAINDILKTRGHFLNNIDADSKDNGSSIQEIEEKIKNIVTKINEDESILDEKIIFDLVKEYIKHSKFDSRKSDNNYLFCKAIFGYKFNLIKIIGEKSDAKVQLSFEDENWEDNLTSNDLYDDYLNELFDIYKNIQINKLIGNSKTYSEAKKRIYEKHKQELRQLKKDIKEIDLKLVKEYYKELFVENNPKGISYTNYIGKYIDNGNKKKTNLGKIKREDLIKKLKKIKEEYNKQFPDSSLLSSIELEDYLIIPNNTTNRLIPYQFHLEELKEILNNFEIIVNNNKILKKEEIDTIKSHLICLLGFKVPYFVGPLSDKNNENAEKNQWLIKNDDFQDEKVNPYNFDKVVNKEATNETFIKRMLRKCTYLYNENCMQQETILYQDYIFYNTINKIKINDHYLSNEQKQNLHDLLISGKSLTPKTIIKSLALSSDVEISGFSKENDKPLDVSLSAYKRFKKIFVGQESNLCYQRFFDQVIDEISILDKNEIELRKNRIRKIVSTYSSINVNEKQIEDLAKLSSKKYGNLSEKFLADIKIIDKNGEHKRILDILKDSNLNLMEIIYANEDNLKIIDKENGETQDIKDLANLHAYLKDKYIAPQARRAIIQANRIVDEIIKIMHEQAPEQIAIEFTREKQEKGKETISRYDRIAKIYKEIKDQDNIKVTSLFSKYKEDKSDIIKRKKVYLYFMQRGRDLYTGKVIDFDVMINSDDSYYNIDHIYPRSRIKDDSFENLVLTSSTINGDKGNVYPLPEDVQINNIDLWKSLKSQGLMSDKKYERLTRQTPLKDEELNDFISRQKTTLDWINQEVADIFKIRYDKKDDSNFIIYSKSRHVSEFRNEFKLYKIRELNNFHHAHDAYLNIILGRVLKNNLYYQEDKFKTYNYLSILKFKLNKDIEYIKKILEYNDILVTKKTEIKNTGAYWDQNILAAKESSSLIPIKRGLNVVNYGGYNSASTAFFTILKDKKGKKRIIPIRVVDCNKFYDVGQFNEEKYKDFIKKEYNNEEIMISILPINAKVLIDGMPLRIAGKDGNNAIFHNTGELVLSHELANYFRKMMKIDFSSTKNYNDNLFTTKNNIDLYNNICEKISISKRKFSSRIIERVLFENKELITEKMKNMELIGQINLIKCMITQVLKANSSNVSTIFGKKFHGVLKSFNIQYSFSIIRESVTGFYTKKIDINNV